MRLNIHNRMDDWFLLLSENPDKLDEYISRYEHSRIIGLICTVIVLALLLPVVFMSGNGINFDAFIFIYVMFVFIMVINVQTDIYTKVLKLQRQQQKRDTKDAKSPSEIGKKSSISLIALIYGPALGVLILGILTYIFYVMD